MAAPLFKANPGIPHPNTVSGLVQKRAELSGQIEYAQIALRKLIADMDAIDSAIRIFDPNIDLPSIKRRRMPRANPSFRHDVQRISLETLREADAPVSSRHIAHTVMEFRGLDVEDRTLERMMVSRVGACLRRLSSRGIIRGTLIAGRFMHWEITPRP